MQTEKKQYLKFKIHWMGLIANKYKGIKNK